MTPEQIAKQGSEDAHQAALFACINQYMWENKDHPAANVRTVCRLLKLVYAIPNGGHRHKAVAGKLKATGVKSGVWDIHVPVPMGAKKIELTNGKEIMGGPLYYGLYVEMKEPARRNHKNGGLSDEQVEFGNGVRSLGYQCAVCYTWEEAFKEIVGYLGGHEYEREGAGTLFYPTR